MRKWITSEEFAQEYQSTRHANDVGVRKVFTAAIETPTDESRTVKFRITSGAVDRERDVIDPRGWDITEFMRSPSILFAHDYKSPPIGKALTIEQNENGMSSVAEFASAEVYPFADTIFRLIKGGFLNACSVGFAPLEWVYNEDRRGVDFKRQSLLEWSVVPVGAHQDALVEARAAGVDVEPLRAWAAKILDRLGPEERVVKTRIGEVVVPEVRIEGTADGVRKFWSLGAPVVTWKTDSTNASTNAANTPAVVRVPQSPNLLTNATVTGNATNVTYESNPFTVLPSIDGFRFKSSVTKPEMVHPDADGTCPSGYAMGDDGMCHEKAVGRASGAVGPSTLLVPLMYDVEGIIKEAFTKRGRVLSGANERRLREAADAAQAADAKIREVVAQVEAAPEISPEGGEDPTELTSGSGVIAAIESPAPKTVDAEDAEGVPPSVEAVSVPRDIGALGAERDQLVTRLQEIDGVLGLFPSSDDIVIDLDAISYDDPDAISYDDPDDVLVGLTEADVRETLTTVAADLKRGVIEGLSRQLAVARGRVD